MKISRRSLLPWLLSLVLHGGGIGFLILTSTQHSSSISNADQQEMQAVMVNPATFFLQEPKAEQPQLKISSPPKHPLKKTLVQEKAIAVSTATPQQNSVTAETAKISKPEKEVPTSPPNLNAATTLKLVARPAPVYPPRALALQQEGEVKVRYDINRDGRVENITILSASPPSIFENSVKQAMQKWRYSENQATQGLVIAIIFQIDGNVKLSESS